MKELVWSLSPHAIAFRLLEAQIAFPITSWASLAPSDLLPGIGLLLGWMDQLEIAPTQPDILEVPHGFIATLLENQARQLHLPAAAPFVLNISHDGLPTDTGFRFRYRWTRTDTQPVMGPYRTGSMLKVGGLFYRLPEPIFSLLEGMDSFNAHPSGNSDSGFRAWEKLRELLDTNPGASLRLDDFLKTTRVVCASHFTLDLQGSWLEPEFDPVLLKPMTDFVNPDGEISEPKEMLAPHYQKIFARRFRETHESCPRYVLKDGWYVVLDKGLREALEVVKRYQNSAPEIRREFVRNPHAMLRDALSEHFDETVIESLFLETAAYSARVREVGYWQPKVLPWLKRQSGDEWLPPEEFGLQIGGKRICVKSGQVDELLHLVKDAITNEQPFVKWQGEEIPATKEACVALQTLIDKTRPPPKESTPSEPKTGNDKVVLLIEDDLETLTYQVDQVNRPELKKEIPASLKTPLKLHQKEGLDWLQNHWVHGSPGVLLADDMGLGKTLQALSFLSWLKEGMDTGKLERHPMLIVAPTGLLENWKEEEKSHLREHGLGRLIQAYGKELKTYKIDRVADETRHGGRILLETRRLQEADWILTTYETLRDYQHSFGQIAFAAIVFDEAQKIKTPGVMLTEAAKAMNAAFVLAMTGTPIENRLSDLWCIVDTVQPGLLGELKAFAKQYEADPPDEQALVELKCLLLDNGNLDEPKLMLRRLKRDSLQGLPKKTEHLLTDVMPASQASAYSDAVLNARANPRRGAMLEALHSLRSISLHPYHQQNAEDEEYLSQSARLSSAFKILDDIQAKNEKALVFLESNDTQAMQGYLSALIQRRYGLAEAPMLINGTVNGPKRQERVRRFQDRSGFDVMILSPRAGGVGITLTAANHVIHLSRWWNPAVEDQCTDRIYRIGQKLPVHVYYPLAIHPEFGDYSFDRRLQELLLRKRHLSRELLAPPASSERDLDDLFRQTVRLDYEVRLPDFDSMEPRQFERWVLDRLQEGGYVVRDTPITSDGGADGWAYLPGREDMRVLIQCKHTQNPQIACGSAAVEDLIRARERYDETGNVYLMVAVTNAYAFSGKAQDKAKQVNVELIARDGLVVWPMQLKLDEFKSK